MAVSKEEAIDFSAWKKKKEQAGLSPGKGIVYGTMVYIGIILKLIFLAIEGC